MNIIVKDVDGTTVYTKYSLPNLDFNNEAIREGDNVILVVKKGKDFPSQEDFNRAGMR